MRPPACGRCSGDPGPGLWPLSWAWRQPWEAQLLGALITEGPGTPRSKAALPGEGRGAAGPAVVMCVIFLGRGGLEMGSALAESRVNTRRRLARIQPQNQGGQPSQRLGKPRQAWAIMLGLEESHAPVATLLCKLGGWAPSTGEPRAARQVQCLLPTASRLRGNE